MSQQIANDVYGVLRGLKKVTSESLKYKEKYAQRVWANSSMKTLAEDATSGLSKTIFSTSNFKDPNSTPIEKLSVEALQRTNMVLEGVRALTSFIQGQQPQSQPSVESADIFEAELPPEFTLPTSEFVPVAPSSPALEKEPLTVLGLPKQSPVESLIEKRSFALDSPGTLKSVAVGVGALEVPQRTNEGATSLAQPTLLEAILTPQAKVQPAKPLGEKATVPKLADTAKARTVPSTRIGRMISFGSLFAGLGVGTVAEVTRRSLGVNESLTDNPLLTPANVDRIVSTMCKVRGCVFCGMPTRMALSRAIQVDTVAVVMKLLQPTNKNEFLIPQRSAALTQRQGAALKIGQLLSIQDSEIIPPALQIAFERVRHAADFMPTSQVERVLKRELGANWREKFVEFDVKPFAAASIGQVHWGKLKDGTEVAVKIQYPGVAAGINSDIENLVSVLNIWNVFPPGMFIDKLVEVAKKELSWEVDYLREAECTRRFRKLLEPHPEYYVPRVIDELCTAQVFTSELIEGFSVDKAVELDIETRNHICRLIMHLCLKELFVFRVMQTDPNWSNFFYNQKTRQLVLLDFGATRSYDKPFMDQYLRVIKGAADKDREAVLEVSREMGFLTGYESKAMEEAHVDTVMILGEVFSESAGVFDFGKQNTVRRVTTHVPTMLNQRLCPPPEEIYSIHRKISGVFLLCSKLKVKMECRGMLIDIYNDYRFGEV